MNSEFGATTVDSGRAVRTRTSVLEWLVVGHVAIFTIAATWAFGGQADWVRRPLTVWGALSVSLTLAALLQGVSGRRALWWWAMPVALFNLLVLAGSFNPSMTEIRQGDDIWLAATGGNPHWPSSARPELARRALLEFDAVWLACFNIPLVITTRRALRRLLTIMAANACALAVYGTTQKLSNATGIFFGAIETPQKYFFATFVYHNHWGAFTILMSAICLALAGHYRRRHDGRSGWQSPATLWVSILLVIIATVPFSASRSATLLSVVLLAGAGLQWFIANVSKRREYNESIMPPLLASVGACVIVAAAAWYVAGDTMRTRYQLTKEQIAEAGQQKQMNQRYQLYRDTFRMGADKPWFGWGMASYPHVFTIYNTRAPIPHFPVFYHDAHSDWLQSFAEHGAMGSLLLAGSVLVPFASVWRKRRLSTVSNHLFAGCALILVYALFEFPLGNYAVVLCWWAIFYTAVHYARLSRDSESLLGDNPLKP